MCCTTRREQNEQLHHNIEGEDQGLMKRLVVWAMPSSSRLSIVFWGAILAFSVLSINNEHVLLSSLFRFSDGNLVKLHIPSGLDTESIRRLSLNLGGGDCEWQVSGIMNFLILD